MLRDVSKPLVAVVGQGYVGIPISMAAVDAGYKVVGIDFDTERVDSLQKGMSPTRDVSSSRIAAATTDHLYRATSDYQEALGFEIGLITVPTPLRNGIPDLSFIQSAAEQIGPFVSKGCTVILESTTYPGTTEELLVPILESKSGLLAGKEFFVGYSPERIDPGNLTWNLLNTPKVVSGIDPSSLERVKKFYESLGIQTVPVTGTKEAEMAKLLENTFRHVNIAMVNELALFSRELRVNIWEAIEAASTKPFGFMKFLPGPGVGGHCLPIDPSYLSWAIMNKTGAEFRFVTLANEVNSFMPQHVVDRCKEILGRSNQPLEGLTVVVVGLAYKSGSSDLRESPSMKLIELLEEEGARVLAVDPLIEDNFWPEKIEKALEGSHEASDLVVLMTNYESTKSDWVLKKARFVLEAGQSRFVANSENLYG